MKARQLVSDQITTLFQNKLRSQLDVSFADANLAQAKLLLLDAQNNYQASLSHAIAGSGHTQRSRTSTLVDTAGRTQSCRRTTSANCRIRPSAIVPEIAAQNYEYQAAQHFQKAERDSTVSHGRGARRRRHDALQQLP